ncbi:MAG: flagellin [Moraxellaceae bacterium]|nr:flagellin [Moraxellaceae bacterium]MDP1775752.1 flagellin [Moraxellaceae bacterium]MDZ4387059.1 flagellin [Moraxellaceae bacterium]
MALTINTNVASLNVQRNLSSSNNNLATSLQRLSTGLRVNSAKDDAAGLAISERFTAQIRGLNQGARNAADGISLAQTGEAALKEVTSNVQRIREIAVQAANGTNSESDRDALQLEIDELVTETRRVITDSKFNGVGLFDSDDAIEFQVGAESADVAEVKRTDMTAGDLEAFLDGADVTGADGSAAQATLDLFEDALTEVNSARAQFGAAQNRFESIITSAQTASENLSAARGRIMDADFASETATLTRNQILQQAGVAMLSQANALPQAALGLLR